MWPDESSGSFLGSNTPVNPASLYNGMGSYGNKGGNGNGIRTGPVDSYFPALGTGASTPPDFWSRAGFLGDATNKGWGGLALQGVGGAANLFMGMQQYGLAKDTLAQAKDQFAKNYAAQKSMTNSSLSDRQNSRVAANPNAYAPTTDYMAQYGIK